MHVNSRTELLVTGARALLFFFILATVKIRGQTLGLRSRVRAREVSQNQ